MSKYTTELRFICEELAGLSESQGNTSVANIIEKARPLIFNFSYPIFQTAYKQTLETKILRHFYTREIGLETFGLWQMHLETRMNEIMPYFNDLYKKQADGFSLFDDVDYRVDTNKDGSTQHSGQNTETRNLTNSETYNHTRDESETRNLTDTDNSTKNTTGDMCSWMMESLRSR